MARRSPLPPLSAQVSDSRYCFLSTSTAPTKGLRLLMAGREFCREEYQVVRQGYPSLALELVVAGSGTLELGGKKLALLPGMIFSYGPGVPHSIRSQPGERLVKYFVDFVGIEAERLMESSKMKAGKVAMIRDAEPLVAVFDLLINRGGRVSKNNTDLCTDYLRAILRMSSESLPLSSQKIQKDNCYNRAVRLIDQEYASLRTLEELAGRFWSESSSLESFLQSHRGAATFATAVAEEDDPCGGPSALRRMEGEASGLSPRLCDPLSFFLRFQTPVRLFPPCIAETDEVGNALRVCASQSKKQPDQELICFYQESVCFL